MRLLKVSKNYSSRCASKSASNSANATSSLHITYSVGYFASTYACCSIS